ncbi:MAG TPA: FAD:protein FMN transferase, partial [Planctomycetota bacterium]|nr:FAD:protein FMN transferase [Planctomycetota bacterium]
PAEELARLQALVGPERVLVDEGARTIAFDRPGVRVDLDGLNKGVAVDRVLDRLRAAGVTDAVVSAGGSTIGSIGPPPGRPAHRVAIEGPDGAVHARIALRDAVLSTSGAWRRAAPLDGREAGPIFDPRTGEPADGEIVSATVIAPRGDESEAYAKAALVLGIDGARQLLREHPELGIALLLRDPPGGDGLRAELFGTAADPGPR